MYQGEEDKPPRTPLDVILSADEVFGSTTHRPVGYSPALGVHMARAHCWAPYDKVASALRSLALEDGLGVYFGEGRKAARSILQALFKHPAPFRANSRFPQGQVFLSVDHGVFGQCVYKILAELQRLEAAADGPATHGKLQVVDAAQAFVTAVASAAAALARPEEPGKPVLYDQHRFEEAFGLTWKHKP